MAEWLVAHGASVNEQMPTGWTAMHAAAKAGDAQILEMLLKKGGNKNIQAKHRNLGWNLKVADVARNYPHIQALLEKY